MTPLASSCNWSYDVFPSCRGIDVRNIFLYFLLRELERNSISVFRDIDIGPGHSFFLETLNAIRDSRIAVVIFSPNYASSSWCLNELVEILRCKKELGRMVIPIFHSVDPSDVRKQSGDFGEAFRKICHNQTEEVKNQWTQALTDAASIRGFHFLNWRNEAEMVEAITKDVLDKLLLTTSKDSEDFVGIEDHTHISKESESLVGMEDHISNMSMLLQMESEEVRIVGIWGPSGIGKSTIARALSNRISRHFEASIFIDTAFHSKSMEIYNRANPDDYNMKLHLQTYFLSKLLQTKDIEEGHLGSRGDRLKDKKVLIVIDDLDDQVVYDALVGQGQRFGSGSRIIVVTKDIHILKAHGINDHVYEVLLPSEELAVEMLCQSAFRQKSPPEGFRKLVVEVARHASSLPLGLTVLGSSLRTRGKEYWMDMLTELQNGLDGKIEKTLRLSYDLLEREVDKEMFLHIACFFNGKEVKDIKWLLEDSGWDVNIALKNLAAKSLIHVRWGCVEMHPSLQEMGLKIVRNRELGKRKFLGMKKGLGISVDTSEIDELQNLRFEEVDLKKDVSGKFGRLLIPEILKSSRSLRLLPWFDLRRSIPSTFYPEYVVQLEMRFSKLEMLWEGTVCLPSLKEMDLHGSLNLKEIPDLSMATSLKELCLDNCSSLTELPSSIRNLNKLEELSIRNCINLETLPTDVNLESLDVLNLSGCSRLKTFPCISTNISDLNLNYTAVKEVPQWVKKCSRLEYVDMKSRRKLKYVHLKVSELDLTPLNAYKNNMQQHQVFINFWGEDVRISFISHLVSAFSREGVNVFIGKHKKRGEDLERTFQSIECSNIALVVFSSRYTESRWCLEELVKIKELMDEDRLLIIPVFYKVEPSQVKQLEGDFGLKLWNLWRIHRDHRITQWKDALESVASMMGSCLKEHSSESKFITSIVEMVREAENLSFLPSTGRGKTPKFSTCKGEKQESFLNKCPLVGHEQHMKQLEQQVEFDCNETRIIGIVGMAGIGKTTLAIMLHEKLNSKFVRCVPLLDIHKKFKNYRPARLRKTLFEVLLGGRFPVINDKTTHECLKDKLLQTKVFVVLDDVSNKKQLKYLLGNLNWLKKGSKIIITSRDKSLIEGFVHNTYVVPPLNYRDALQLFSYHAFGDQVFHHTVTSMKVCRKFVECAGGNPLVIKLLCKKFHGRNEAEWEMRQEDLIHLGLVILDTFRSSCDELSGKLKDIFLDIACFFGLDDGYFARSLLDSGDHDTTEAERRMRLLIKKGMIAVSVCRVEMHGLLHIFGKLFSSKAFIEDNGGKSRLWYTEEVIDAMINQKDAKSIRGIFLDMSEIKKGMDLHRPTFINMINLWYLKIYDSRCPRPCKAFCKLHLPDGLEFSLEKVRYLHWVQFPLRELPPDFKPNNLVDLRLPYSSVERLWKGVKDTSRLKWVDLSHSSKLLNLSALINAENLQRLNLEGCTNLEELSMEMQNMKSLVYLNMRGCIRLRCLPEINMISLKTLILSDCSNLNEFQVISKSLEVIHLEGTAIKGLPPSIEDLQRLILLNMKNCKMLECLPNFLGQLKDLEELVLSGCSRLKILPDVMQNMKHVQILLLDGIEAKEMPKILCFIQSKGQASVDMLLQPSMSYPDEWPCSVTEVSTLRRLCLSGNDFTSLQIDIGKLYNLIWLDVKQCKKLRSVPMLPPRLQYFDAHGCESLEKVANPLTHLLLTDQGHAIFNFSNCNKLDQDAQDSIISYTRRRSQLLLGALSRHNEGFGVEAFIGTCFPGWEVPEWFSHRGSGSVLESELPPLWCDNRFSGIALCAVISYPRYIEQMSRLSVNCSCEFKNEDGSSTQLSFTVGGWNELSETPLKIESSHVFIGYTSRLNIRKYGGYDKEGCFCTKSSFEFQVTDGTREVVGCEVIQCGFSLIYATNEIQYQSYSDPTLQWDCERKSYGKKFKNFKNVGGEITIGSNLNNTSAENVAKPSLVGVELRLKQLERVLYSTPGETRIVGVVGVPGIGKTTLANILFERRGCRFPRNCFLKVSDEYIPEDVKIKFLEELIEHINQNISEDTTDEFMKDKPLQTKAFVVLDNVSDKKQLKFLLGNLNWIKKGSKIVVTTCDKSLVEGLADDTYVVPHLNNKEALQVFMSHAFDDEICSPRRTFLLLSSMFVDNAGGNPIALKLLASELRGKGEAYWVNILQTVKNVSYTKIEDVWRFCINQLNESQRDVLLDISCFFTSENEYFVKSLVDSRDPDSTDSVSEVRDLAEKFLITISDGQVEMNDGLSTLSKDMGSTRWLRLWKHRDILDKLRKMKTLEANNVRGIFLDMSEILQSIAMECRTFTNMHNLRYLKIYESCCSRKGKSDCKLKFPDGFDFPLEEIRYFHWLKFPLEELPQDFRPKNLVDLRLPYSNVARLWKGVKDTPRLKWVDLSHSTKLLKFSAISKAESLQRLNLEGCTNLEELSREMQNMRSLVYLNMRGCIRLRFLPKMNLISLKTLILSDCSNLKEFQVVSKSLEVLHLDGTAIKALPLSIENLQRLVRLNLKNCKLLECLPNCLSKLKVLEELILSGCSRLENLPDVRHSMKHVQILLFDGTGVDHTPNISCFMPRKWPVGVNGESSLQRLCLSGHDFVSLHNDIRELYNLTWLDVKHCKNLISLPMLPPRLQYFDAHGCDSLERVANPLAIRKLTEQIHATFNFSNCCKLDQDAMDAIISYTWWKSQSILDALNRYNEGITLEASVETCFPGWEVPACFSYQASGSLLEPKLPPHWCDSKLNGIALCAVILFPSSQKQRNCLSVKCNIEFKNEDGSRLRFSCPVGGWSEPDNTIESSHIFIGYASKLDIKKLRKGNEEGCVDTEALFEFQVTDGTKELEGGQVLKCGFRLVYESDDLLVEHRASPRIEENKNIAPRAPLDKDELQIIMESLKGKGQINPIQG